MCEKFYKYLKVFLLAVFLWSGFIPISDAIDVGETFVYDIKKLGINVGTATFEFKGETQVEGQNALLLKVIAKGFKFYDEENIYLDKRSFLPRVVVRNLDIFGKKETITERYFQDKGVVEISGRLEDQETGEVTRINLNNPIDNIYGFIYRYRLRGQFVQGEEMQMQLPTRKVNLKLIGEKALKISGEKKITYYLEDSEKKIKVWFGQTGAKIPYRINGAIGFGNTSLILNQAKKQNLLLNKGDK